jgi:hypothetical protein
MWHIIWLGVVRGVACLLAYYSGILGTAAVTVAALSKESPGHFIHIPIAYLHWD